MAKTKCPVKLEYLHQHFPYDLCFCRACREARKVIREKWLKVLVG